MLLSWNWKLTETKSKRRTNAVDKQVKVMIFFLLFIRMIIEIGELDSEEICVSLDEWKKGNVLTFVKDNFFV